MVNLNVVIQKCRTLKSGAESIRIVTPELNDLERKTLKMLEGWKVKLSVAPLEDMVVPELTVRTNVETRTASQKLRAVIYLLWEENGSRGDAEQYYYKIMGRIISKVAEKIDGGREY